MTDTYKPLPLTPRKLLCYRYHAWALDYDEELIWSWVQSHQGYISIRQDCIDFFVPVEYAVFFVLLYPDLEYMPDLDYV